MVKFVDTREIKARELLKYLQSSGNLQVDTDLVDTNLKQPHHRDVGVTCLMSEALFPFVFWALLTNWYQQNSNCVGKRYY